LACTERHRSEDVTVYSKLNVLVGTFQTSPMLKRPVLNFFVALHFKRHRVLALII